MCFWTLPAIIVGIIMILMAWGHHHNQAKREQEFEEQMKDTAAEDKAAV